MAESEQSTRRAVDAARAAQDDDQLAKALVLYANTLVQTGAFEAARDALDEAVDIHREYGRTVDEARCTQFAATVSRFAGDHNGALARVQQAARLAGHDNPISVAVATEHGETALQLRQGDEAADAYAQAFQEGQAAGLKSEAQGELLRKRAQALVLADRFDEAAQDLEQAYDLLVTGGNMDAAVQALIERATLWHQVGDARTAEITWQTAFQIASGNANHRALAELFLLRAAQQIEARDLPTARQTVENARQYALDAVAPVAYINAAAALSQIAEKQGDLVAAYEALAVGWVTLNDLTGPEVARQTFAPLLTALRERLGEDQFVQVKTAYEARRRDAGA